MTADAARVPAPTLSNRLLVELLDDTWGLPDARLTRLGSERDINVLVDDRFVLKIVNPAESTAIIDMQLAALELLRQAGVPVPAVVPTRTGAELTTTRAEDGSTCTTYLVTALPGTDHEGAPVDTATAFAMGSIDAQVQQALRGFFHPAAGRAIGWDLRRLPDYVSDSADLAALLDRVAPALAATRHVPAAVQHADITLSNVLFAPDERGRQQVSGVIDLGDMHHTAAACDLAITLASVLRNTATRQVAGLWELTAAVLDGYQQHRLLEPTEVAIFGELVLARLGLTEAIAALHADRSGATGDHITRYRAANRRVWAELMAHSPADLARRFGRIAGTARAPIFMTAPQPDLLRRRHEVMGGEISPLFYRRPLHIVRGQGPWLYEADGRRLLDAYNNVAVIGHAHPAVTQAVSRQLAVLNTHSRYVHGAVIELAERIVATMPDGLDTVLFTTSGTEANELAWRIATAATGSTAAIVAKHAYHGSTKWMADLSPSEWPQGYRAPHVGLFRAPHGLVADADPQIAAQRIAEAVAGLPGQRPALVAADSMFTSEGILETPGAFFTGLVDGAHQVGALYLADEVQAGYGRPGAALWRFALSDAVPDMVSLGKPMGAGYPIGALVTRRELADRLAADYEYFSTFAATPAAAAAGLAVLDVLQDQQIPAAAAEVGEYLRERVRGLRAPQLGQVRGIGLVAGIDLLPPEGADPREWARDILNGLLDRGVMAGLTGPTGTVLKVRPPLIWQPEHADLFVDALADTLAGPS